MPILPTEPPPQPLKLGISACLSGARVRYNGGHKRARELLALLDGIATLDPICPEVGIGLGAPRQPIRLLATTSGSRAVASDDPSRDVTAALTAFGQRWAAHRDDLDGFILTQKSPSCGLARVKVYHPNGHPAHHQGVGLFAAALQRAQPLLPLEEAGRLQDPALRENFFTRCYTYQAWKAQVAAAPSLRALEAFHAACKYRLMAHDQRACTELGRLIAQRPPGQPLEALCQRYIKRCMAVLATPPSRRGHTNALLHLFGYLKGKLSAAERSALLEGIHGYHQGQLPLVVPLRLLRHFLQLHGSQYANQQRYLSPHPDRLGLLNAL